MEERQRMRRRMLVRRDMLKISGAAAVGAFALGVTGCASGGSGDTSGGSGGAKAPSTQTKTAGSFEVTLLGTRTSSGSGSVAEWLSQTGSVLVIAKFAIVYNGSRSSAVSLLDFSAEADGKKAELTSEGTSTPLEGVFYPSDELPDGFRAEGVYRTGERLTGEVCFVVPKGWKSMTITFRSGSATISFAVSA